MIGTEVESSNYRQGLPGLTGNRQADLCKLKTRGISYLARSGPAAGRWGERIPVRHHLAFRSSADIIFVNT